MHRINGLWLDILPGPTPKYEHKSAPFNCATAAAAAGVLLSLVRIRVGPVHVLVIELLYLSVNVRRMHLTNGLLELTKQPLGFIIYLFGGLRNKFFRGDQNKLICDKDNDCLLNGSIYIAHSRPQEQLYPNNNSLERHSLPEVNLGDLRLHWLCSACWKIRRLDSGVVIRFTAEVLLAGELEKGWALI